jgi:hypothetical protein
MTTYVITKFDEAAGQIIVRFDASIGPAAIDLPIENGLYITGDTLDAYIKGFIPTDFIERAKKVSAGIPNAADIAALVVPEDENPFAPDPAVSAQLLEEQKASDKAFIVDVINEVLAAKGL